MCVYARVVAGRRPLLRAHSTSPATEQGHAADRAGEGAARVDGRAVRGDGG